MLKKLYYSVPCGGLLSASWKCFEEQESQFQNSVGMNADDFITLLEFYFHSTTVIYDGQFLIQRTDICIGS